MILKFNAGAVALEIAAAVHVDHNRIYETDGLVAIDLEELKGEDQITALDEIRGAVAHHGRMSEDDEVIRAAARLSSEIAKRETLLNRASDADTLNDTHANSEAADTDTGSHSLPTGDASNSLSSQQDSDATQTDETEEQDENGKETQAGGRKRAAADEPDAAD